MESAGPACETLPPAAADWRAPDPFAFEAQGQSLVFYPGGQDRFDALLALIAQARTSLRIAFYIFSPDASGIQVRDAVIEAARRGVAVSVVVDGFGAKAGAEFFAGLVEAGGTFCCFMPRWSVRYLIRNHQKMVVVDGEIAMLGGFNVEDSYFAPPAENGWNDLAFTVRGSLVGRVAHWFDTLEEWARQPGGRFRDIRRRVREWDSGTAPVQLLVGGPTRGLSSWARCVSRDLIRGERLDMMMAYFSPPFRLRKRIRRIAEKGNTRLVMAGKSDNNATIGASRALYRKLLKAGAQLWEFNACKLHTKLIVLDDAVYMGSANFDMRSLYVNLEIVVRIEDKALADRMSAFIGQHIPASLEITPALHERRATVWNRIRWWSSWFLVSVVDYTVSRKLNLGL
ncbi:phospholipase D-like domain-containing protein [Tsuneonella sp. HG222]